MRALLVACSRAAYERMLELKALWEREEPQAELVCKVKCAALPEVSEKGSLIECVGEWFPRVDAIVFFGAAGIAVRSIAPWIVHKGMDPAVIVMDETGKYCISLLSGHWGGANALTQRLAGMLGAVPVITTATDREEKFAVDLFARKNGLILTDWKLAKKISARILEGERVSFYCEPALEGEVPKELTVREESFFRFAPGGGQDSPEREETLQKTEEGQRLGIAVSCRASAQRLFRETLQLIPRAVVAGVGCKKGTSKEKIGEAIGRCLEETDLCPEALCAVASIDLKREEEGILSWCAEKGLPFLTYTAEVLKGAEGDFSESAFVESVTGVANVCERSAVVAAKVTEGEKNAAAASYAAVPCAGSLLCRKKVYGGVTVALALKKVSVKF